MAARSGSISRECAGVSRGRCEGGGVETPELPGPLLREGKVEPGSVPMPDAPDQGAAQTRVSAALSPAPHRAPPPAQWPAAPDSSSPEEREPRSVLGSRGRRHRPQGEDAGLGPQGGRGAVGALCSRSPPCPVPLQPPLCGATPRPRGAASGSADAAWAPLSLWARRSGTGRCRRGA